MKRFFLLVSIFVLFCFLSLCVVPFQMTGYTLLLIACLGPCVLAGIGVMALLIPVSLWGPSFFALLGRPAGVFAVFGERLVRDGDVTGGVSFFFFQSRPGSVHEDCECIYISGTWLLGYCVMELSYIVKVFFVTTLSYLILTWLSAVERQTIVETW